MKKYRICLFLFLGVSLVCVLIAFLVRRNWENSGAVDTPETAIERDTVPETVTEDQMAANNDHVQAVAESREIYDLVEEDSTVILLCPSFVPQPVSAAAPTARHHAAITPNAYFFPLFFLIYDSPLLPVSLSAWFPLPRALRLPYGHSRTDASYCVLLRMPVRVPWNDRILLPVLQPFLLK